MPFDELAGDTTPHHLCVLRALSIAVTGKLQRNEDPATEAALVKDLGTTFEQLVPTAIADAVAADPAGGVPAELMQTLSYVSEIAPAFSLRGGTREVLRGMIARGLGVR